MIIFEVEHQRAIVTSLSLSRALLKAETLPVLCLNLTTSPPLKIPNGKSNLEITPFSSEIVRTKGNPHTHFHHLRLCFHKYDGLYQYVLFGWVKRKWLLSATGEIQTEAGEKKEYSTGHRGQLGSLSSHRFRCCLLCIVRQPPVSPKDAYLWH